MRIVQETIPLISFQNHHKIINYIRGGSQGPTMISCIRQTEIEVIEYTYDIVVFLPMNNVEYLHDDLDSVRKKKVGRKKTLHL